LDFVVESEKKVPVLYEVDVAVAGAGLTGVFVALASAKHGAETLAIDRFGSLGGHLGPGMVIAAGLTPQITETVGPGFSSIPAEFMLRIYKLRATGMDYITPANEPNDSSLFSYVALKMMEEYGVKTLLSAYVSDPILEEGKVSGLFVETKSGRAAVKAKVVVDATGDADVARRAGAPVIRGIPSRPSMAPIVRPGLGLDEEYSIWNETGLYLLVGGVDWKDYEAFLRKDYKLSDEELHWAYNNLTTVRPLSRYPNAIIPLLMKSQENDGFDPRVRLGELTYVGAGSGFAGLRYHEINGLAATPIGIGAYGEIDTTDAVQISRLESAIRKQIFEVVQFHRKYVPGWEKAYLFFIAPYLGARGGPWIDGEYTLTVEDMKEGRRFPDVMYVNFHEAEHGGSPEGYDVPYRILLPKKVDGLLVTARGAAFEKRGHDPSGMRCKPSMMVLGHATGIAAALAVRNNVAPNQLDVKELQRTLAKDGFCLGDEKRLEVLNL